MQNFLVSQDRVETAQRVFQEKCKKLNQPELMTLMVMNELGYYDKCTYDEFGDLTFDLTELQWVAVAAAFASVSETGGQLAEYEGKWQIFLQRIS